MAKTTVEMGRRLKTEEWVMELVGEVTALTKARDANLAQLVALIQLCTEHGLRDEALEAVKKAKG